MNSLGWATGRENCHEQYTGSSGAQIHEIFADPGNFCAGHCDFAVRICSRRVIRLGNGRNVLKSDRSNIRILQFAPRVPWPLDTGAKLRNYHLARVLAKENQVSLLAFSDAGSDFDEVDSVYQSTVKVLRGKGYSFGNLLRGAIGRTPLPLLNYTSTEMKRALERVLSAQDYDIVQIESIHLMDYLPVLRAARKQPLVVCDWHNIESDLMRQYATTESNVGRKTYARRTARLMNEAEQRALDEFDAHVVVSEVDAARLRALNSRASVLVIENGVDVDYYGGGDDAKGNRIVFVGSMDYHANIEGVRDFATNVWPDLSRHYPQLVFTIVGRDPDPAVRDLATIAGVEVTGSVKDVRPFYREARLAVVPLNVGGGSRLKILEAMAAGVPVVSTVRGAEGLKVTNRENILLVDSTDRLGDAIKSLIEDDDLRQQLVRGGRDLVADHYDWQSLGNSLSEHYRRLVFERTHK